MGAGEGAVNTVTAGPPPCGFREMLNTFTPITAQSSVEASCIITFTFPVWVWVPISSIHRPNFLSLASITSLLIAQGLGDGIVDRSSGDGNPGDCAKVA